ncbi:hypothetical protein ACFQ08_19350 [Streptosporangium algeriense]|uniref:DUF4926 domain-containing protein n=1 Tax=Streptosporangium algeriense TaxID=1682748 RepID=A0ABW3DS74_9ACTN
MRTLRCPREPARAFRLHDRVRLRIGQEVAVVDEHLADEGEDAMIQFIVPRGTAGKVAKVRTYPAPLPYVILTADSREFSVPEYDLERIAYG